MKKISFLFILIFSTSFLFAQNDFRPGKVFLTNGDTLTGTVNFNNRSGTYVQLRIADKDLKTFGLNDLNGYEIEGNQYIKKTVVIDKISYEYFLETLVSGRASLFHFKSPSNETYYFLEKDGNMFLLKGGRKIIYKEGTPYEIDVKDYWGILKKQTLDCETLSKNFPDFSYKKENMLGVVEKYNACFGEGKEVAKQNNRNNGSAKRKILKGLRVGANYPVVSLSGNKNYFNPSPTPTIGAFVNIPFSGSNKNLSSFIELAYSPKWSTVTNEGRIQGFRDLKINFWDINAILRYSTARGIIRPILGAGVFGAISSVETVPDNRISFNDFVLGYQGEAGINIPFHTKSIFVISRVQKIAGNRTLTHWTYSISVGFGF